MRPSQHLLLSNIFAFIGAHDETKADIRAIVQEAEENGGYQSLPDAKKELIIATLQRDRNQKDLQSTTTHPAVQLHDVRVTFNRISQEVR